MIPVTQSRTGDDGTCFRACIASILEVPERRVPDFGAADDEEWWDDIQKWLSRVGLAYRRLSIDGARPKGWSTIEGVSPRGGLHACVAYDGELVHDPHPQDGTGRGLVEPRYYGVFEPVRVSGGDWTTYDERPILRGRDRADLMALRRNTERQGGPFFIQETTEGGKERTLPVRSLSKGADARMTVVGANAALRAADYKEKLVRGNGYYYFVDGEAYRWYSASIPTNSIVSMTAADIIRHRNRLADDYRN